VFRSSGYGGQSDPATASDYPVNEFLRALIEVKPALAGQRPNLLVKHIEQPLRGGKTISLDWQVNHVSP
jgi:hypothetical protein